MMCYYGRQWVSDYYFAHVFANRQSGGGRKTWWLRIGEWIARCRDGREEGRAVGETREEGVDTSCLVYNSHCLPLTIDQTMKSYFCWEWTRTNGSRTVVVVSHSFTIYYTPRSSLNALSMKTYGRILNQRAEVRTWLVCWSDWDRAWTRLWNNLLSN